jgi:hypothetical protein
MRNQVLYASVIFTISALLIGAGMFSAEAREGAETITQKGNGVVVDQIDNFLLTITPNVNSSPNDNSKDYTLKYGFLNSDNELEQGLCKEVSDKLVKIAALKKATIEFNTKDAGLGFCKNIGQSDSLSELDISVNFFNADPIFDEAGFEKGPNCDGNGNCSHEVGTEKTAFGDVTVNVGGVELIGPGKLYDYNTKVTYWTE